MSTDLEFPDPVRQNGRLYWDRWELETYKSRLAGYRPQERDPSKPVELVPSTQVVKELGFGRRTLGRRIAAFTKGSRPDAANAEAAR